ncbi:MAG: ABC transporter permease [Chloroflexi bacterium]|nr:ABC transporter permease [Chloroflexota bacterium]
MDITQLLNLSVRLATPVLLVALGGLFSFRTNIFNIALEGFMLFGCFASIVGAYLFNSVAYGVAFAVLVSLVMTLIYAVFVFEWDVDPIICAIAIITISSGLTRYLLIPIFGTSGRYILPSSLALPTIYIPLLEKIPFIGPIFNNHSILVYLSFLLPFLIHILLYQTDMGLSLRAVGLNAEAAEAAGISVKKVRYFALAVNGILCGLAGAQLALSLNLFNVGMTNGRGWTALAALLLTGSEPILTLLACILFGFSDALVLMLSGNGYPVQILSTLPYVLALMAAILPPLIRKITMEVNRKTAEKRILGKYDTVAAH